MKARHQRNQNSPFAPRPHWQGKTSHSLRESWSTAPAATVAGECPRRRSPTRKPRRRRSPGKLCRPIRQARRWTWRPWSNDSSPRGCPKTPWRRPARASRSGSQWSCRTGRASKLLLGGAMCTALAVVVAGTLAGQMSGSGAPPVPLVTTQVVATPVATAAPPAPPPPRRRHRRRWSTWRGCARERRRPRRPPRWRPSPRGPNPPRRIRRTACAQVLRRGRFRDINQWCAAAFAASPQRRAGRARGRAGAGARPPRRRRRLGPAGRSTRIPASRWRSSTWAGPSRSWGTWTPPAPPTTATWRWSPTGSTPTTSAPCSPPADEIRGATSTRGSGPRASGPAPRW